MSKSARDVIARKVSLHAECESCIVEDALCSICKREADAILSALEAAGYVVVPQTFSTNAVMAIRDKVQPHINRHDVRCDDGRVRLEIRIDFPEIYKAMLTAAKETP